MKNITLYYIKKRLPVFLIVLALTVVSSIIFISTTSFTSKYRVNGELKEFINTSGVIYLSVILMILATIIPIYEFAFKMKRNGCDLHYSLPIKRNQLFTFKYIFGLCELLLIFIVNFIIVSTYAVILISNKNIPDVEFNPGIIYLYLPFALITGTLLYSWTTFFYTRANRVLDGIIGIILSNIILLVVMYGLQSYIFSFINYNDTLGNYLSGYHYSPIISIIHIGIYFDTLASKNVSTISYLYPDIILWSVSVLLIPLFIILSYKERAEVSEDISDNIFLYKTMLPIYIIFSFMLNELGSFSWIAIVIGGYIGYVIYNRNFLLKKNDLIVLASSVGIGFILMCTKLI